ncbi:MULTISPECIES: metal ABC transporter permease [Streptomyces]|uniref:Metal ABC transporter permease n=1 Tax=Streptomyces koelreuteriae TaxID=2838015 RepID=A0ABX8FK96_9ACTN|nr:MULTISPECIES: metal ABC transporter permease [Streptomyces]QWB21489.1 metal ABC transporter permease [Streptomyces koelreuteriae]UUA04410.1 metal ABC transporter permease [Streptomyces koelreuteriae]UUA12035.1 metal ABC transporter permease [Streptomyces sp. CRCS-T-1]
MTLAAGIWHQIFDFTDYGELLALVRNSLVVGVALGLVGGLAGVFVLMRDLPFAVHGISELSFAGASAALLLGVNIVAGSIAGSLLAAGAIGVLGTRARDRNSVIGIIMPFGLGLGVLFLALYKGRAANKFGLLTGQIVAVDTPQMSWLLGTSVLVLAALAVMWRPLAFASTDPDVAEARGVPVRALSFAFMLVLGLAVALSVQVVGALLVLSLVVTPAAAAARVTASAVLLPVLSVLFAVVSIEGGILLALGSSIPISPYVTTISFGIYAVCRLAGGHRARRWGARRAVVRVV